LIGIEQRSHLFIHTPTEFRRDGYEDHLPVMHRFRQIVVKGYRVWKDRTGKEGFILTIAQSVFIDIFFSNPKLGLMV
jgi:hypothetical protein